jgi:aryl-alcohol dehydrogenase-like predicted oxidoreductase
MKIKEIRDLGTDEVKRKNLDLVDRITEVAVEKHCTPSQLALAWVMAQGDDMVAIPGTKRRVYLEENVGAVDVRLSPEDLRRLDKIMPRGVAAGLRYPAQTMAAVNK